MGLFKKGFSGFDRRTSGGKELGAAADVATVAGKGALLAGKGAYLAGKFVVDKIKDAKEAKAEREQKKAEIKNQLQGIRVEDPSGYIKSRQWATLVRELLEIYPEGHDERSEEIKNQLQEIRVEDPSGYIKIKRFWYSAEKNLNNYFDKQTEERLKEENSELFNKYYKKLKRTYFWCNFEEILGKYKEKVGEETLKEEDPKAYKWLLFRKRIKMILFLTPVILIVGGVSMCSIQECSPRTLPDGTTDGWLSPGEGMVCKNPLF